MFMPFQILGIWFRSLLTIAILGGAVFLLAQWQQNRSERRPTEPVVIETADGDLVEQPLERELEPQEQQRLLDLERLQARQNAWLLAGGLGLLLVSVGGRWIATPWILRRVGDDEPRSGASEEQQDLRLPDGSTIHVHLSGPRDGQPLILTHGWGLDGDEWYYTAKALSAKYRVIAWDLPGLGQSGRPPDRDWSLEKLAAKLDFIVREVAHEPVVLVGHSIGVMITLTYCKVYPEALGERVVALVLGQGTYTNPVRTTSMAGLYLALQKPVLEPLCHLMVWLSPMFRVMNWLSFLNGSATRSTASGSFTGRETRGQLDFLTRYYCFAAPDVVGRGMLAMLEYDATATLGQIPIPTLVVTGEGDRICLPEASRWMAEQIPRAELLVLGNARHCGVFEFHQDFNQAIDRFLDARAPGVLVKRTGAA